MFFWLIVVASWVVVVIWAIIVIMLVLAIDVVRSFVAMRCVGVDRLYNTFEGDEDDDEVETTPPPPNPALMANLMTALKWPAPAESTT